MNSPRDVFTHVISQSQELKMRGHEALAVFDLDSTLFCVSPRTEAILRELATHDDFHRQYPEECQRLAQIEVLPEDWGIRTALERSGIRSTISFFESVRRYWYERFFSSSYLQFDKPYPGALEYVQSLSQHVEIYYLTGRDDPSMGHGTRAVLKKWGFPLPSDQRLLMKPDRIRNDEDYKTEQLRKLQDPKRQVWFFENEPVIIEKVLSSLPSIRIVYVDSVHSGRAEVPSGVPKISSDYRLK